ncbi:hypothetical protein SAMN04487845_102307 [Methylobacterium sp. yr668]|nr:hypothetical protein SAMN04487845_102307 [Methylobacterium sp. yr668]
MAPATPLRRRCGRLRDAVHAGEVDPAPDLLKFETLRVGRREHLRAGLVAAGRVLRAPDRRLRAGGPAGQGRDDPSRCHDRYARACQGTRHTDVRTSLARDTDRASRSPVKLGQSAGSGNNRQPSRQGTIQRHGPRRRRSGTRRAPRRSGPAAPRCRWRCAGSADSRPPWGQGHRCPRPRRSAGRRSASRRPSPSPPPARGPSGARRRRAARRGRGPRGEPVGIGKASRPRLPAPDGRVAVRPPSTRCRARWLPGADTPPRTRRRPPCGRASWASEARVSRRPALSAWS